MDIATEPAQSFFATLDLALTARTAHSCMLLACRSGNDAAREDYDRQARNAAYRLGRDFPTDAVPPLIRSVQRLKENWTAGRYQRRQSDHRARIDELVAACDWKALGVPAAADLLAELLAKGTIDVEEHGLTLLYGGGVIAWESAHHDYDEDEGGPPDIEYIDGFLEWVVKDRPSYRKSF